MGFVRSTGEPCMYRWEDGDDWAIIALACDNAIHLESSDRPYSIRRRVAHGGGRTTAPITRPVCFPTRHEA